MRFPQRGEIYLVEFDPTRGHEIQKTWPAVVLQNNVGNRYSPVTIVAAVTSATIANPVIVQVGPSKETGLTVPSSIHLGRIRSIDRQRLGKRLGALDNPTMRHVDAALKISLGLVDF